MIFDELRSSGKKVSCSLHPLDTYLSMSASVESNSVVARMGETLRQLCIQANSDKELQCALPLIRELVRNSKNLVDFSVVYCIIINLLKQLHEGNYGISLKISLLECLFDALLTKKHCECFGNCRDGCETLCLWLLSQTADNMNDTITILLLKIIRCLCPADITQQLFIEKLKISQLFLDLIEMESLSLAVFNEVSGTCAKLIEVSSSNNTLNSSSFLEDLLQSEVFCDFLIKSVRYNEGDYYREYIQPVLRITLAVASFGNLTKEPFISKLADKLSTVMDRYHMTSDIGILIIKVVSQLAKQNTDYKIQFSSIRFYGLLISALKVHWERKEIVEEVTKLIIFLADNEDEKLRFYRSEQYDNCCILSNTLSKYVSLKDSSTISLLCQGIFSLSEELSNERYFTDNGCCEILTRTLKDLLSSLEAELCDLNDQDVQAFHDLLKVMTFFASQTKNKEKFRKNLTIPLTLQILSSSKFLNYPIIIKENIHLIRQLGKDLKLCQSDYLKQGIYELLLNVIRNLRNEKDVLFAGIQALIVFTDSKLGLEIFHEKKNCLIIVEIFAKYLKDSGMIKRCSELIANIAETIANQMEIGNTIVTVSSIDDEEEKRDCCSLLTEALFLHLSDEGIVLEIANAVAKLGKVKNNQLKFGLSGIIALLIKALEEHQQRIPVVTSICRAIRWITITSNEEEYKWKVEGSSIQLINSARTGNIVNLMETVAGLSSLVGPSSLNSTSLPHLHFTDDLIPSLLSQNQWESKVFEEYHDYATFDENNLRFTKRNYFLSSSGNKLKNYDLNLFMNASNIIFSEKMNLNRLQFRWLNNYEELISSSSSRLTVRGSGCSSSIISEDSEPLQTDGCSLLAKLVVTHLKTFPVFKVLLEAIMNLSTNLHISNKLGENNICKHLVLAVKDYYRSLECLLILLPTVKVLAANDDNKIRFGNAEACKECIELFKHWHRHPKIIILIVNTMIPLTEDVVKKHSSSPMMMNSPEGSSSKKSEKDPSSETVLPGLTVAGPIPRESFELLLRVISANLQDTTLLRVLGRFLLNLTKNQSSIPAILYPVLTNAINAYLTEYEILKLLLNIVSNVCQSKGKIIYSRCNKFGHLLAYDKNVLVDGLKTNPESVEILKELLPTLYLLLHSKENKIFFLRSCNCFQELEKLLYSYKENIVLVPLLVQCIGALGDYSGGEVKRNFGGISVLFAEILTLHGEKKDIDKSEIIIAVADAISLICKGNENNQRLYGNFQIPRLLTKALFDYFHNSTVVEALSLTIFCMNENISDNKELFGNVACCEKLFEALIYYNDHDDVITVSRILEAIQILASESEMNQKRFEHMGAFEYIAKLAVSSQPPAPSPLFSPLYRFASFAYPSPPPSNQQQSAEEAARTEDDSDKDHLSHLVKNFSTNTSDSSFTDDNEVIIDDPENTLDDEENDS
jgi:hypothetical protein